MSTDVARSPETTTVAPQVLLVNHFKALKLPTFAREYEKVGADCAREGVDYPRYLLQLCELERIDRERRTMQRRIRLARFPVTKSLDTFDFMAMPTLNKSLVLELARCEWIDQRENVIALGPSGVGKTHTVLALGLAACQKGHSVAFTTAATLVHELMEASDEKRLRALLDRLTHHVHILEMNGESYRLAISKKRQQRNVKPNSTVEKGESNP
ncbi:DNA replication protein DnaC [Undibacterium sp. GrIS 1.8]|uniref:ATP-binding protein n=1 Tax=unclassified Undibacterium TaxID=2630295 RepID=UPI00339B7AE4